MPCITPNHDLALVAGEDAFNLIASKFFQDRPQLFRRISKGMDGVTAFDPELNPLRIGETGHSIEYEIRIEAPPDGKFIDLSPGQDSRTGLAAADGQLLFKCGILIRLWDPLSNKRWQFELPAALVLVPVANGQNEQLVAQNAVLKGLVPPAFQNALDYVLLELIGAALKRLSIPGNLFQEPPASVTINIKRLSVANNLMQVDADVTF
jgi:hypothetical protein